MLSLDPAPENVFPVRIFEEPLVPSVRAPGRGRDLGAGRRPRRLRPTREPGRLRQPGTGLLDRGGGGGAWRAALLLNLGLEYYNSGYYSRTIGAWSQAWELARHATDPAGKAVANRAVGELASMYARLGRMAELEALLASIEGGRCRGRRPSGSRGRARAS